MTFPRTLVLFVAGALAVAAQTPANPITTNAQAGWSYIKSNTIRTAEKMPEEHYAFKPVPEVRSFAEIVIHILDENNSVCTSIQGTKKPEPPSAKASKADIVAALRASVTGCDAAFKVLTDANAAETVKFWGGSYPRLAATAMITEHTAEHYGNLVTYLRLKGVVPPASAK